MRCLKIISCIVLIFFAAVSTSGCKGLVKGFGKSAEKASKFVKKNVNAFDVAEVAYDVATTNNGSTRPAGAGKTSRLAGAGAVVAGGAAVANEILSDHWIKDMNSGAYVWNPEPQDGESVRWSGDFVEEDGNRFAQGRGTLTWYKYGEVIQTDEGVFDHGRHHGQFRHTFKSGRVDYSNWDHGQEIPLENSGGTSAVKEDLSANRHWIKDLNNGAYVWNPEPQDGESVRWSGSFVEEGGNRYAQGRGTLTWYKNGEVIQTDEGSFERGRHHGQFRHTFRSGRVDYSNWDHGQEIP